MIEKLPFLPDEHHYAIAAVAARTAQLDSIIALAIASGFQRRKGTAEFILRNLGASRFVDLLSAMLLDAAPKQSDEINTLIKEITRIRRERNDLMHWLWGKSDADPSIPIQADIRPFREAIPKSRTAEEIQKLAEDALSAVKDVSVWMAVLTPPLPKPWPAPSPGILAQLVHPPSSPFPSDEDR